MTLLPGHHERPRWLLVMSIVAVAVIAIVLWTPAPVSSPSPEQEAKIADLVVRLGSEASTAVEIDDRLRSFGPFPPDAKASRVLAEALIRCKTTGLGESPRTQLVRHLYGITVIDDDRAEAIPAALIGIQQVMASTSSSCGADMIDRVINAARAVAITDPHPRPNWW